jgi:hypothetical protein
MTEISDTRVKISGVGEEGAYVELADGVKVVDRKGNPEGGGDDWEPSRWEIRDNGEFIWKLDYSGVAASWEDDPREAMKRKAKEFAGMYSLGKKSNKEQE